MLLDIASTQKTSAAAETTWSDSRATFQEVGTGIIRVLIGTTTAGTPLLPGMTKLKETSREPSSSDSAQPAVNASVKRLPAPPAALQSAIPNMEAASKKPLKVPERVHAALMQKANLDSSRDAKMKSTGRTVLDDRLLGSLLALLSGAEGNMVDEDERRQAREYVDGETVFKEKLRARFGSARPEENADGQSGTQTSNDGSSVVEKPAMPKTSSFEKLKTIGRENQGKWKQLLLGNSKKPLRIPSRFSRIVNSTKLTTLHVVNGDGEEFEIECGVIPDEDRKTSSILAKIRRKGGEMETLKKQELVDVLELVNILRQNENGDMEYVDGAQLEDPMRALRNLFSSGGFFTAI